VIREKKIHTAFTGLSFHEDWVKKSGLQRILFDKSCLRRILWKRRENGRNVTSFRAKASVASDMGWLWTEWIGPAPVQMSGMLSVRRAVVIVCGLFRVWSFFSLTSFFFVNSQLDHFRAWIPACSLTEAQLYRCFPSNLSTTTQGAIVKLCKLRTVLGYVGKRGWGMEGY